MAPMVHETRFAELEKRRRELGMSRAVVAKLAGVSEPTVTRILTNKEKALHFRSFGRLPLLWEWKSVWGKKSRSLP